MSKRFGALRVATRMSTLFAVLLAFGSMVTAAPRARPTIRVLFIGNSYTYFNNLADIVAGIAAADDGGTTIETALAVRGSASLKWHLQNGTARRQLAEGGWDYVVLQETSFLGAPRPVSGQPATIGDPAEFYDAVRQWTRLSADVDATPILFMPWAIRERPADARVFLQKLSNAHFQIGRELGIAVAPVGLAWLEAQRRLRTLDLHIWDGSHPTAAGSYLAACVLYARLTSRNPLHAPAIISGRPTVDADTETLPRVAPAGTFETLVDESRRVPLVDLPQATALELQKIAWDTVTAKPGSQEN